ncbi:MULTISPECIES: type II secretion system protein [Candidatus Ichthyocystis]|uniref:Putative type II secretion system protein G n=1 Tax=Candidatus Ichthyocystis hellenicum TaxID=1561003 RepID=A0A0S4M570_9BURK|nr:MULTISPECIES: type II secretion system protein [Ichthyocystis]CUT17288.1 putative type II secretion system protein G [Candidatus Ichthyocystis hellenicum]
MAKNRSGFTLVEAIITALILGVMASMVMAQKENSSKRAKEHELRQSLKQIRQAIDDYRDAVNKKIIIQDATQAPYPPSLSTLVKGVKSSDGKKIYFLRRIPRDPFSNNALEAAEETWNIRSYTSPPGDFSQGNDVYDVSSKSDNIGLNGIPYKDW